MLISNMPEGNNIHGYYRNIKNLKNKIIKGTSIKVLDVFPKGKVLFLKLSNNKTIVMRFGMSGYLSRSIVAPKYTKKTIEFEDAAPLHWVSVRTLGTFKVMNSNSAQKIYDSLGPDPLLEPIRNRLDEGHQRAKLSSLLLNQSFLSGIGNRLRAQILWEAGLSPQTTLGDLSSREKDKLARIIKRVMLFDRGNVYKRSFNSKGNPVKTSVVRGRTLWWV